MTSHTEFQEYNPAEQVGVGRTLIEASAGTGKTFTIAAMVTRLIAEEGINLSKILVVTFTRAAASELKDRIRQRILKTWMFLDGEHTPDISDEHMRMMYHPDLIVREERSRRLSEALNGFDSAAIFTIHGFAMRLLRNLGFCSRLPHNATPGEVDDSIIRRAAADLLISSSQDSLRNSGMMPPFKTVDLAEIGQILADEPDLTVLPDLETGRGLTEVMYEKASLAKQMREMTDKRMTDARKVTYDDTLVEALEALKDDSVGGRARALLNERYMIALVDEAQDTDPIQWDVIQTIFDRLVIIGDPKQAIYAFRGADIKSYLTAADNADIRRTLRTNWRADGPLIEALDHLMEGTFFGETSIQYRKVSAAPSNLHSRIHNSGAPLQIRSFADSYINNPKVLKSGIVRFSVGEARQAAAEDTASEIVNLLNGNTTLTANPYSDIRRAVNPEDIAVLCRTRKQVDLVRSELDARAVPSVATHAANVFTTPAAEHWRRFLYAVEHPNRMQYVRMAAATPLGGVTVEEAAVLTDAEARIWQQRFYSWQKLMSRSGIEATLDDIKQVTGLLTRMLPEPGGERTLTDIDHVASELQKGWSEQQPGTPLMWLEEAMTEAKTSSVHGKDSRQRRLETDNAAVKVLTIHAAKGSQHPIVFVPYLWDNPARTRGDRFPVFHNPDQQADNTRRRYLDVGSAAHKNGQGLARQAADKESERLLYVALTRAQHRLVVWYVEQAVRADKTKLKQMLDNAGIHPGMLVSKGVEHVTVPTPSPLVQYHTDNLSTPNIEPPAQFNRQLDYEWQRASFSSLSPDHPLHTPHTPHTPDDMLATSGHPQIPLPMADIPGGADFGTLFHDMLDRVNFTSGELVDKFRKELEHLTRDRTWDFGLTELAETAELVVNTPLHPDADTPTLRTLNPGMLLNEMRFEIPVRNSRQSSVTLQNIAQTITETSHPSDPHLPYFQQLAENTEHNRQFRGFLTGAIDLVAAIPTAGGHCYTVIDYKTNTLPTLGDIPTVADYSPHRLRDAMHHGHYPLQALLYQVALHRYLQLRMPGYIPSTHLGGSMYLFVRGMIGADTPTIDGGRCGVDIWQPHPDTILAVSELLGKEAGT